MNSESRNIPNIWVPRRVTKIESGVVDVANLTDRQIGQARANIRARRVLAVTETLVVPVSTIAATLLTGGATALALIPGFASLVHGATGDIRLWRRGITQAHKAGNVEEAAERYYTERNPKIAKKAERAAKKDLTNKRSAEQSAQLGVSNARSAQIKYDRSKNDPDANSAWILSLEREAAKQDKRASALIEAQNDVTATEQRLAEAQLTRKAAKAQDKALKRKKWKRPPQRASVTAHAA
jgi:hypothetical protein